MKAFLWEGFNYRYVGLFDQQQLIALEVMPIEDAAHSGDIYMGRVAQAIPSQEAYFVDIGENQLAYLQGRDIAETLSIRGNSIKVGDWVMVQIKHEAHGSKGPKITDKLAIQGRWVVLLTGETKIMASQKIRDVKWRTETVRAIEEDLWLQEFCHAHGMHGGSNQLGLILRTEAREQSLENIYSEVSELMGVLSGWGWHQLSHRRGLEAKRYYRPIEAWRAQLEQWLRSGAVLYTNCKEEATRYKAFSGTEAASALQLLELPVLTAIKSLLKREHPVLGGCSLVIDELEALTAIDVNSASFNKNFGDVSENQLALNLSVLPTLLNLIQLRGLSGMLLVDFVNMLPGDQKTIESALQRDLKKLGQMDVQIKGFTRLGILEMTKKRRGKSLLQLLGTKTTVEGELIVSDAYLWDQILLEIDAHRYHSEGYCISIWEGVWSNFIENRAKMKQWLTQKGDHLPEIYVESVGLSRQWVRLEPLSASQVEKLKAQYLRWI